MIGHAIMKQEDHSTAIRALSGIFPGVEVAYLEFLLSRHKENSVERVTDKLTSFYGLYPQHPHIVWNKFCRPDVKDSPVHTLGTVSSKMVELSGFVQQVQSMMTNWWIWTRMVDRMRMKSSRPYATTIWRIWSKYSPPFRFRI